MPKKNHWPYTGLFLFLICVPCIVMGILTLLCHPCHGVPVDMGPLDSMMTPKESLSTFKIDQSKPQLLNLANRRLKQGLWQESVQYANALLSMEPENIEAHGILGTIHALTGARENAQKELTFLKGKKESGFFTDMIEGILMAQEGKYQKAEAYLESALKKQPRHPVALYYTGSLNLAQKRFSEAEGLLKDVVALAPDFAPAMAGLGQVYLQQNNMKKAADHFKKAINADPDNLIYRQQLFEIYKATNQKEAANQEAKEILYRTPGVKESYLTQGMRLLSEGSYQEAIDLMDKMLGIYQNFPEAYYIKAAAQINLQDKKSALENIEYFVTRRVASPQAHHYAGMCYLALDQINKAEEEFRIAISINPKMGRSFVPLTVIEQIKGNYKLALNGLRLTISEGEPIPLINYLSAHILLAKGDRRGYLQKLKESTGLMPGLRLDYDFLVPNKQQIIKFSRERNLMALYFYNAWYGQAIQSCRALLKLNQKDLFAWYYKALSEIAQNNTKDAMLSFNQLIDINPRLIAAHMGLGRIYEQQKEYQKAVDAFKKVIAVDPKYGPVYVAMGDMLFQKRDEDQAIEYYKKAIRINPKALGVYQKLALILSEKSEQLDEAMQFAAKAEMLAPEDPLSLDVVGWVYLQKGETDKAIAKLEEASKGLPRDAVIQYHLGVAYYQNNDIEKARDSLQAAVKGSKDFRGLGHAREILKKISR